MEAKSSNQEIDLMDVLVRLIDFLLKNIFLTVALPLAGILIGWALSMGSSTRTESQMMLVTQLLSQPQCEFLLVQLEKTDSFPNVSEDQRNGLISIRHKIIEEPKNRSFFHDNELPPVIHIEVTLRVKNDDLRKVFENSIVEYLETSQPSIRKKEELREFSRLMVKEIDSELASLEKVKASMDSKTQPLSLNPTAIYTETINLTEKKIKYESQLKNEQAFQIVKGFDGMNKTKKASSKEYALIGFALGCGLLAGVLFLKYLVQFYLEHRKTI